MVRLRDRLVQRRGVRDGEHRAEDLLAARRHLRRDIVEDRRAEEVAGPVEIVSPIHEHLRALPLAALDEADDALAVLLPDQRADEDARLIAGANGQFARLGLQRFQHRPLRAADRDGDAPRQAALARVAEGGVQHGGDRQIEIGVRQYTMWFFAPPAACTRLPCFAASL